MWVKERQLKFISQCTVKHSLFYQLYCIIENDIWITKLKVVNNSGILFKKKISK